MSTDEKKAKEAAVKNPFEWLFRACLLLCGCAILLNLAVGFLAGIWPWIIGIGVVVAVIAMWIKIVADRRRKW